MFDPMMGPHSESFPTIQNLELESSFNSSFLLQQVHIYVLVLLVGVFILVFQYFPWEVGVGAVFDQILSPHPKLM